MPPPAAPDVEKLVAAGTKYGIENVGPPVQFNGTPRRLIARGIASWHE